MKLRKHLLLFQLIAFIGFAQNKPLSTYVKSQFVNEEGMVQFVEFDETSKLNFENRSDLLKEFLKTSENTSFVKLDSQIDKIGFLHETYQQYFASIPVEFGIYKAHLKNGVLSAINGDYYPVIEINTNPTISAIKAVAIAHQNAKDENYNELSGDEIAYKGPKPTLVIFPKMENINALNRLAYKLDVYVEKQFYRADVYVDAHTGEIIFENSKIHKIDDPATGTTLYNGGQSFLAEKIIRNNKYRLRQSTYGNGIHTLYAANGVQNATDITTGNVNPLIVFNNNNITNAAVQVHWGTEKTYEYFMQKHARNSFDNNGALIKSYIIPVNAVADASWDGSVFRYSMGNGSTVNPVTPLTSLDVVGHEITHAVIDHSADLIFSSQSGAINESYADIFGEMVENFGQGTNDWLCGAACVQNGLRSMSNPKSKGHPDTYLGQYWQTTDSDNFGVHTNSGVHNKWFYLLAVGGTGTNDNLYNYTVSGIGIQKAAEIAYRTLTYYLTPSAKYHYACEVSIYAASQLFGPGSPERIATSEAWRAVGVLHQPTEWVSPTKPLNLVVTNATPYDVSLSWDASTDNVAVAGYTILLNGSAKKTTVSTSGTVSGLNLQNNIAHEFTVRAFDAAGNYSAPSNIVFVLFDTINPTVPTNLSSSDTTQNSTFLSWNPSTDNFGVVGYEIYQSQGQGFLYITTVPGTSYTVYGLAPSSTYSFYVRAIDAAGNQSGVSNTAYVTTLATLAPCASGIVTLTITVDWNPEDISWDIRDASNAVVVAPIGNYPPNPLTPYLTTFTYYYNLASGSYTLNMYDTYGDGIWSPGGYVLSSNVVIASGNETNPSANTVTTPFCIDASLNKNSLTNAIELTNSNSSQINVDFSGIIFPNPVLDRLYFKDLDDQSKTFLIVDLTGKIVMKGIFDNDNSVDVNKLQSGIYILKILGKEETENYKFIKK